MTSDGVSSPRLNTTGTGFFFSRGRLPWSSCRRQRANWLCAWCAASWRILTQIAGSGSFLHSPGRSASGTGTGRAVAERVEAKNRGAETEARYHRGRRRTWRKGDHHFAYSLIKEDMMMKIFKSQKPAVCGTAKRPIRRWLLPPKKQQAYRFYSTAHFHVYERCRHFRRG